MTIDLEQFEDAIHLLIAERGKEYVDAGHVRMLTETAEGWTARIEGQESYEVLLKGHDVIHDWHCTCPFEHGPVCKHVAAALFVARESVRLHRAAARGELDHFVETADAAWLRQFLKSELRRNKQIREAVYAEMKNQTT